MKWCQIRKIARPPREWIGKKHVDLRGYQRQGAGEIGAYRGDTARFFEVNGVKNRMDDAK